MVFKNVNVSYGGAPDIIRRNDIQNNGVISMRLKGKTAIITGGASGIGRAVGEEMARSGAIVILADRNMEAAEAAAREINDSGGSAEPAALDVTDAEGFERLLGHVVEKHGSCDYLFNNAGVGLASEVRDMTLDEWNLIIDVNLRGVIHGIHAAYPHMIRQGSGHIVNTASVAALSPFPLSVAYTAAKSAIVGLSVALRAEAAGLGVKVSVICPGFIDTPMRDTLKSKNIDKKAAEKAMPFKYYPVEKCARDIMKGVSRDKAIITVGPETEPLWMLYRISPEFYSWASQFAVKKNRAMNRR